MILHVNMDACSPLIGALLNPLSKLIAVPS